MESRTDGPQRSDAQRNRERILEVALAELTRAVDVPLSLIAKKAGVGQGTFYRNFPNREALVLEVYRREAQQLADAATELLETRAPDQALREWMDQLARFAVAKVGLSDAMRQIVGTTDGPAQPGYALVVEAIEALLAANHEAGTVRPSLTSGDFILAVAGIWQIGARGDWQTQSARLLDIVMDGLRAGAPGRG
ncbi:TetR family transcriptional regulator [Streptomyces viridochromogenes]|uniref:TetR family transcriptional regulator n=1 Tax=Streptomyces viridochromogenes TaxID=1938 RepID=A0A0J7ZMY6_STRVR|nr:TetR/AcrR family transcriptional regulator [Streptomyces viridochromogenes]KMS76468.1 TetR family transcriptional regulator [Streptomyces viridochromogenes]KOG23245.1 TetR family transcriptional regulator [Streptomyces viridochromogenes]KOG27151.1 TetR family transcriptional regulator [Streptomyces viridochromogenes]